MQRYNKFNTVYKYSRQYALIRLAGPSAEYKRFVYQTFKKEVCAMFKHDIDRNAWVFDQNELKTIHTGKQSLKQLCEAYYIESEAMYLADNT